MRRRRGALAKVKLKMPVAVWPPPVDAEQGPARGPRGGPPRRFMFTSPPSPSPLDFCQAFLRGPAEAGTRPEGTGRCAVLRGGARSAGAPGPAGRQPGRAGARSSGRRHTRGRRLEINCAKRSGVGSTPRSAKVFQTESG